MGLKDTFETRIYLMFLHFSIFLIIFKRKKIEFVQKDYDNFFNCVENNLRELGYGDIAVNKKMKTLNKIFYDILLKINQSNNDLKINKKLVLKYFFDLNLENDEKYGFFEQYFNDFYHFCFELNHKSMIKDASKFRF